MRFIEEKLLVSAKNHNNIVFFQENCRFFAPGISGLRHLTILIKGSSGEWSFGFIFNYYLITLPLSGRQHRT
jgi:hypothetical protein